MQAQQLVLLSPAFIVEPGVNVLLLTWTCTVSLLVKMTLTINHNDQIQQSPIIPVWQPYIRQAPIPPQDASLNQHWAVKACVKDCPSIDLMD